MQGCGLRPILAMMTDHAMAQWAPGCAGDGPRNCPGQRFALKEAKIALHHIFSQYTFRLGPGMDPLPLRNALTMSPQDGVQVTVHRRR